MQLMQHRLRAKPLIGSHSAHRHKSHTRLVSLVGFSGIHWHGEFLDGF